MTRSAWMRVVTLAGVVVASVAPQSVALADTTSDMSRAVVMDRAVVMNVVRDTALPYPARCFAGHRAKSSPGWAYLTYAAPPPRGCPPGEGAWVVAKQRSGEWQEVGITLLVITCPDLRVDLARVKAPGTVFAAFRAAGVCQRG